MIINAVTKKYKMLMLIQALLKISLIKLTLNENIIIIILFIVQCWTQASKPEPLKQITQKRKRK